MIWSYCERCCSCDISHIHCTLVRNFIRQRNGICCRVVFWTAVSFISAVYIHTWSQPQLSCCHSVTWHWRLLMYRYWFCLCYALYFMLNVLKTIETCPASETFTPPSFVAELLATFTICWTWTIPLFMIKRDIWEDAILPSPNDGVYLSDVQSGLGIGTGPWSDSEWHTDLLQLRNSAWIWTKFIEKALYVQNVTNWEGEWYRSLTAICVGLLLNVSWRCVKSYNINSMLTHCGWVTQICVYTLQLCKTGEAHLRF